MSNKTGTVSDDGVIWGLLHLPGIIQELQKTASERRRDYNARATELAIESLSVPHFPGKKADDPKHTASNEDERDMAAKFVLAHDEKLCELATNLEAAQRALTCAQNRLKSYRMIARLTLAGKAVEE